MQRDAVRIIDSCVSVAYWMRGATTYSELLNMTYGERERVAKFIQKRLEQEKKNPYPNY